MVPQTAAGHVAPLIGQNESGATADQYIVVLDKSTSVANAASAAKLARSFGGAVGHTYTDALTGFSANLPAAAVEALRHNPSVAWIEADQRVHVTNAQTNATWGLDRIDQRDLPLNGAFTYNATGSGVKAYIIDTGIRFSHSQFGGRAISGYDAIDGGPADDCHGHGTHVAGTVGGSTYGVAKAVALVAVRVLNCEGWGYWSEIIAGVDWVTSNHQPGQPAVANMSLGGDPSEALETAVNNSILDGVTYAIAAGNNGEDACYHSPARVGAAITVAATSSDDWRASFSNYGTCVDIFAPGSYVTSAWNSSNTATKTISGTSMATPHVAGVAALYLQSHPTASPTTVRNVIVNSATTGVVTDAGYGSSNRLLYSQLGSASPPTGPANDNFGAAQVISGSSGSVTGSNVDATGQSAEPLNYTSDSAPIQSVWYAWTAPATGDVEIDTCDSSFDTTLGIYLGSTVDTLTEIASNDDDPDGMCGAGSWLMFTATAGVTYRISVDGYGSSQGSISLSYWLESMGPANDDFDSADVISNITGSTGGSNVNATGQSGEPLNFDGSEPIESVWWSWTAPASDALELNTCGSSFDTTLGVYVGATVDSLTQIAGNDDDPTDACGRRSRVAFTPSAGATYYFSVDGYGGGEGYISLSWAPVGSDVTPPVVRYPTGLISAPQTLGTTVNVRLTWPAASDSSGISRYELQIKKDAGAYTNVALPNPTATEVTRALTPGAVYRFRVRATDGAGNVSAWASTSSARLKVAEETGIKVAYAGTWTRGALKGSSGGYVKSSSVAGARALFSFNGTNAVLVATSGPARGIADIYIDGAKVGTIDFYSSTMRKKHIAWALGTRLSPDGHVFEVRVTGERNSASSSARIDVDAFVSWP
jgi:aqualysin 1